MVREVGVPVTAGPEQEGGARRAVPGRRVRVVRALPSPRRVEEAGRQDASGGPGEDGNANANATPSREEARMMVRALLRDMEQRGQAQHDWNASRRHRAMRAELASESMVRTAMVVRGTDAGVLNRLLEYAPARRRSVAAVGPRIPPVVVE